MLLHSTANVPEGMHAHTEQVSKDGIVLGQSASADDVTIPDFIALPMVLVDGTQPGTGGPVGTNQAKTNFQRLVPYAEVSAMSSSIWRENYLGSHAFVRLPNEPFLRVTTLSFPFGTAGGHAMLANNMPVISAGEVSASTPRRGPMLVASRCR